jgi:hypothetical protein
MNVISLLKQLFTKRRIRHSDVSQAVAEGIQEMIIEMGYRIKKKDETGLDVVPNIFQVPEVQACQ